METIDFEFLNKKRLVADTNAILSLFSEIFDTTPTVSKRGIAYIRECLQEDSEYLLSIPSVVFIEIFDIYFKGHSLAQEEFRSKVVAEVFNPLRLSPNIEIREIDFEILEKFLTLNDMTLKLENRDRLILASASVLNASLITSDETIRDYVDRYKLIPSVIF